jgi:hypothetical protein
VQTLRVASAARLRGPAWARAAASIALFALLGVGHVLPVLHFALVAHCICAEHGELLHEELLHEAAPVRWARADAQEASPPSVPEPFFSSARAHQSVIAGHYAQHEHDHCGVLALSGSFGVAHSAAWREPSAPSASLASASLRERPAHVGIALLLRAPKLAPPARALAA